MSGSGGPTADSAGAGETVIDVHVLPEAELAPDRDTLAGYLSREERARARGFRRANDRDRFVLFRGALRRVLGAHVALPPSALEIIVSPLGKPDLRQPGDPAPLVFSLSHSDDLLVVAVGRGMGLGIDIEAVRSGDGMARLARRILSPSEARAFALLRPDERTLALWRVWTRKEAYLKGTGDGLSFPLESVTVTLGPDCRPQIRSVAGRPEDPAGWCLHEFRPAPGVIGALATTCAAARLRLHAVHDG